jgi:hypothetical protein
MAWITHKFSTSEKHSPHSDVSAKTRMQEFYTTKSHPKHLFGMDCRFSFDIYSGFLLHTGQPHRGVIACCSGREDNSNFERC